MGHPLKSPLEPQNGPVTALWWVNSDPDCPGVSQLGCPLQILYKGKLELCSSLLVISPVKTAKSPVSTQRASLPHLIRPQLDWTHTLSLHISDVFRVGPASLAFW